MNPTRWRLAIAGLGFLLLTSAYYRTHTATTLTDTAKNFLVTLTPEQKAKANLTFEDDNRQLFHFVPDNNLLQSEKRKRTGLQIREMQPYQKHLAHALLAAGLSQQGYVKASSIMSLEDVLRILEKDDGERRNPEKYYFTIFGEPSEKGRWGFKVEGHHISLNFTVVNGVVVASPNFFGSNPARVLDGPRAGLRVLGREEDLGRDVLNSLTAEQKAVAIVSKTAYGDILSAAKREAALSGQPSGLQVTRMTAKQKELLQRLVEEYAYNFPPDIAEARLEQLKKAGNNLYFAWAGVEERGGPHYYRVQAPAFLIEYDNTQNNNNHIHSVWRDFTGDFGRDLLKEHYQSSPHSGN